MTLSTNDQDAASVSTAPRVSLADMEAKIAHKYEFVMGDAIDAMHMPVRNELSVMSVCVIVMQNGFTLIGKSAPASAANFDRALGKRFAYEDAIRQLWPLEGYSLRERLSS